MRIQAKDFHLEATLESGQVFGFSKIGPRVTPEGRPRSPIYQGTINGHSVRLWQKNSLLYAEGSGAKTNLTKEIRDYFDLARDMRPIYRILLNDTSLSPAYRAFKGLRLIRQDPWEALACFILSSNNNVKRIQGIWQNLSEHFGKQRRDQAFHFPRPDEIAKSHERILRQLGLGYRAPFLLKTAYFVAANPQTLEAIREAGYEEAKKRVLAFPGIGEKVADCVLLYGFAKYEAFPVDVWIGRVIRRLYFNNRKISEEKVRLFGQNRWGDLAGYVQQYLFHGARMEIL